MDSVEATRFRYRPEKITTLFVGESAPISGDFFYFGGTNFTRYLWKAIAPDAATDLEFLERFKARGWYLDDLVLTPINGMSVAERRSHWLRSQPDFAARIAEYRPLAIVTLLMTMQSVVADAARDAGSDAKLYAVPFPGMGNQNRFRDAMAELLPRLP